MRQISQTFDGLRRQGRVALIPYITLGYPSWETSLHLVRALEQSGADLIELGIPFSDPLADGLTIQKTSQQALQQGVTPDLCLEGVGRLRELDVRVPLLLMGYYNPILQFGEESFCAAFGKYGGDGLIVPDLPPEEALSLRRSCQAHGLDLVLLLAPTSTPSRIQQVAALSGGFIYLVSLIGVTGPRSELNPELAAFGQRVRAATNMPLAVGFGISTAEQARMVGNWADGVVVGSALLQRIAGSPQPLQEAERFLQELRRGLDGREVPLTRGGPS